MKRWAQLAQVLTGAAALLFALHKQPHHVLGEQPPVAPHQDRGDCPLFDQAIRVLPGDEHTGILFFIDGLDRWPADA